MHFKPHPTTGSKDQEITADTDSDVISTASYGANDDCSTYHESHKNSPKNQYNTLELSTIIEGVINTHEVIITEIAKLNLPREIFTPVHNIDITELIEVGATPSETLPDNGETLPIHTQPPSKCSNPVDAPDALDSPPQRHCKDTSNISQAASEVKLPEYFFTDGNDKLFVVYQDWVHQNTGTRLNGRIEECGKRQ